MNANDQVLLVFLLCTCISNWLTTEPLKSKLTVTRISRIEMRDSILKTFKDRVSRVEDRVLSFNDRGSRIEF